MIEDLILFIKEHHLPVSLKQRNALPPGRRSPWLIQPSPGYLETAHDCPIAIKDIEWLEIDCIETIPGGKLVAPVIKDHFLTLTEWLSSRKVEFVGDEKIVRVLL